GAYEFGPRYSELELLLALSHGEVATRRVTIPEGYRIEQIAVLLEGAVELDAVEFVRLAYDPEVVARLGFHAPSLEGYLFPDTYRVELAMGEMDAIEMMTWETHRLMDEHAARAESLCLSMHEVLKLASIIEAEALFDRERPRIAAVYHNRLDAGRRLEADPTVRYAKRVYHRKLYYSDLRFDSPYNTYRHSGLPPGPIGSPGAASIRAALHPLSGSDEFFFVANGDGTHSFSRTFSEHVQARERISAERRAATEHAEFSLDDGGSE
ncbi:endolytic transglycosylase MltG, partial [bacterium]|nr:endolytic transglycosylase MltG [bacterium]